MKRAPITAVASAVAVAVAVAVAESVDPAPEAVEGAVGGVGATANVEAAVGVAAIGVAAIAAEGAGLPATGKFLPPLPAFSPLPEACRRAGFPLTLCRVAAKPCWAAGAVVCGPSALSWSGLGGGGV
jgi:hypothetical protein